MALKPCRECGREISTEAKSCPKCGKNNPTGTPANWAGVGCLGLLGIAVVVLFVSRNASDDTSIAALLSSQSATPGGATPKAGDQWNYAEEVDEMTGKVSYTATLRSQNTVEFSFPYNGPQRGTLTIRRHPRWGNDALFSIERGQLLCPSYDGCSVLVRFDESDPLRFTARPAADHSTETIFISNYDRLLARLEKAKKVRVSPNVYQQGNVLFTFDVAGFSPAKVRGKPIANAPTGSSSRHASSTLQSDVESNEPDERATPSKSGEPVTDQPYFEFQVEKQATLAAGSPSVAYPSSLQGSGIEGEVLAQFVVSPNGLAEPGTFKVLKSSHAAFTEEVRGKLSAMRFYAAEVGGRHVPQLVQMPFTFHSP